MAHDVKYENHLTSNDKGTQYIVRQTNLTTCISLWKRELGRLHLHCSANTNCQSKTDTSTFIQPLL